MTTDKLSSRQSAPVRDYLARDAAIVEALRTAGRPLSLQEVGDAIGERKDRGELCRPILKRLVADGTITETHTRPRLFALASTADASVEETFPFCRAGADETFVSAHPSLRVSS